MSTREKSTPRPAVSVDCELYHVMHPSDEVADLWTPDRILAQHLFEQFIRKYGGAHLHVEMFRAGQYDAHCLLRTGDEVAA